MCGKTRGSAGPCVGDFPRPGGRPAWAGVGAGQRVGARSSRHCREGAHFAHDVRPSVPLRKHLALSSGRLDTMKRKHMRFCHHLLGAGRGRPRSRFLSISFDVSAHRHAIETMPCLALHSAFFKKKKYITYHRMRIIPPCHEESS